MDYLSIFERDFGFQIKWSGVEGIGRCPNPHHEDRNPSCSFNADKGVIYCHSCGYKANCYSYAKEQGLDNPHQYIKNESYGGIRIYRPLKTEDRTPKMSADELNKMKDEYYANLTESDKVFTGDLKIHGKRKDGNFVWFYPTAIKHHKSSPNWVGNDRSCQIYGLEYLSDIPKNGMLYIFEGEKDVNYSPYKAISFSSGAGSLPIDLSPLHPFKNIVVLYDNDDAGKIGAEKVAERITSEWDAEVKIGQWDSSLTDGYDVYDDWKNHKDFPNTDKAISNAVIYEPQTESKNKIGEFVFMTGEEMDVAETKPVEWYVDGILPKGFNCMLAGTTGAKKSLYAMQLGLCLANGEQEFCGGKISQPYKVLYVDTEAGQNEVTRRYKKITSHMDWKGQSNWVMMSKKGRMTDIWEDVHRALNRYTPDLLIIDCLYNSTSVDDISKSAPITKIINELSLFQSEYGIDTLTIHHFTKSKHDTFNIDRMAGASALQNWTEYCMLMVRSNRDNLNLWKLGKARGVPFSDIVYGLRWYDFWFTTHGIIDDIEPFMIDKEVKLKYASIIEDLPEQFDTNQWLNVFNAQHNLTERTGKSWLKDATESKMIKKIAHGLYKKHLKIINEDNVNENT